VSGARGAKDKGGSGHYDKRTHQAGENRDGVRCCRLTPVILAIEGAEIRRITVQSQPRQIICETLS
jgi:hypothetical protein